MQDKMRKEICRLDSIADLWYKGQPFRKTDIINNGAYPCIHYGELFSKYGAIIDSVVSRCNTSPKRLSQTGDILFPASDVTPAGLARCSVILQDNVILGGDIIGLRPQGGLNPVYLSYAIRHQRRQLLQRVTGSLIKHISAKSLHSVLIPVHCIERQNLFEKQVRLLSSIIDHRHAQLTALNGLVKCRFVEMFGDPIIFEKCKHLPQLGEICCLRAGQFVKANDIQTERSEGLYPCFGGNGRRGYVSDYTHDGDYPVIGRQGALCGNVQFVRGKFHATEHAVVVGYIIF